MEPGVGSLAESGQHFVPRRKRRQVGRACDACRLQRIKCDDNSPCFNCRARNRQCSNSNTTRPSTLPQAHGEIESLKQKIRELEAELQQERSRNKSSQRDQPQEPISPQTTPSSSGPDTQQVPRTRFWDGIQLRPARSPHSAWFGPSSLYFFTHRLGTFLSTQADHMLIHLASNLELADQPTQSQDSSRLLAPLVDLNKDIDQAAVYLSPVQEEYFISLFWQTYHTSLYAIIDEEAFKRHYQSLYVDVPSGQLRRPSALVDIIVAMCMQYGTSTLPSSEQGGLVEGNDASMAGRWHYRRAQALLACEVESPSMATFQCHLLCSVYLCGGTFHNMADSMCAVAVRTAYMLGLHLDPPSSLSERERQVRRRLWWSVYELDTKVGLKVGRPFLIDDTRIMPELPSDTLEASILSGSTFAPIGGNSTWLSFNLQRVLLFRTLRGIIKAFYGHDLGPRTHDNIYDDPDALEELATVLKTQVSSLDKWVKQVPKSLRTNRENNGNAFSMDGSLLSIEQYAPLWLQRQRLLLEMEYHHLSINLHRPLISFAPGRSDDSLATIMAAKCASHAIELSNITHQALTSTSIINGWHEAFQWQWSAAMTLIGFIMANPQHPLTPTARNAINHAMSVLDTYASSFDAAGKALFIVRTLCTNFDTVMNATSTNQTTLMGSEHPQVEGVLPNELSVPQDVNQSDILGATNFDLFDMALSVDFWADIDMLWPGMSSDPNQTST